VTTLFLSDLHLADAQPGITRLFLDFLRGPARAAQAIYILGDLFEYWAGDDDIDDPLNREIAEALRNVTDQGVKVAFMAGNRDFLVGKDFARRSGVTLLDEAVVVDVEGEPTLLMHGDTLCTDDAAYMQFRAMVRKPEYIAQFLLQPLAARKAQIAAIRARSEADKQVKAAAIMDVNPDAVQAAFRTHGVRTMIHGHTHRPADHAHRVDDTTCTRIVLADWHASRGEYLRCEPGSRTRITLAV
jgi:UDP-2,3-diacylglucosamine hydrolase